MNAQHQVHGHDNTTPRRPSAIALMAAALALAVLLTLLGAPNQAAAQDDLININTAPLEGLDALPGIGPSKAQAIIDYRTSKGPYNKTNDLMHVSGIGEGTYLKLCAQVTTGTQHGCVLNDAGAAETPEVIEDLTDDMDPRLNINAAEARDLQALPGIGPKRAETIVARRTEAPFRSIDEIKSIKGIGEKTFEKLAPFIRTTSDVNQVTLEELLATQAVNPRQAKAIIAHRARKGDFKSVDDLTSVRGIKAGVVDALRPFLTH